MSSNPGDKTTALSRGEIESMCLLAAMPKSGCTLDELLPRLGLSPLLADAVREALAPLAAAGYMESGEAGVQTTQAGREWLRDCLKR